MPEPTNEDFEAALSIVDQLKVDGSSACHSRGTAAYLLQGALMLEKLSTFTYNRAVEYYKTACEKMGVPCELKSWPRQDKEEG